MGMYVHVNLARLRARSDRPAAPAVIVLAVAVVFIVIRLIVAGRGQLSRFVMAELPFANPARVPRGLVVLPKNGYDGQFFYRLALNPTNLHPTAYGLTFDSAYRVQRIGYPVLAWLVSLGHHPWVPAALVIVNIAAVTAIGLLGGMFAKEANRHALYGLLVAGYFGFVFSLGRDTAEPVAAACLLAGLLAYRRRHPMIAALFLAYGALTRETVMAVVAAIAVVRIVSIVRRRPVPVASGEGGAGRAMPVASGEGGAVPVASGEGRARPGLDDVAWIGPTVIFAGWQAVIYAVTGTFALRADTRSNTGHDVDAALHAFVTNVSHISIHAAAIDAWVVEFVVLIVFLALAVATFRTTTVPVHERVAFCFFFVELFVLSPNIWNGVADLRSLDEVYLLAVLILLGSTRRLVTPVLALVPALVVVFVHRTVSL
jgi:hypothetical protein